MPWEWKPSPCIKCGGPKPKGRGLRYCENCDRKPVRVEQTPCHGCGSTEDKGRKCHYCAECKELREWRYQTRRRAGNTRNRKPCEHCGGNKGPGIGQRLCPSCKAKLHAPPLCRSCQKAPVRSPRMALCVECKRAADERKRESEARRARERYASDPQGFSRRSNELAQKRRTDPAYRALEAEKRRLRYRLRQQAKGKSVRHIRPRVALPETVRAWLPGRPLARAIDRVAEGSDIRTVCDIAGIEERLVWAWRSGERNVELATADTVLTRLDLLWWEVWSPESVRVPLFEVTVYEWKTKNARGKRRRTRTRHRHVPYGDRGPDERKLREIEFLMTGQAVAA